MSRLRLKAQKAPPVTANYAPALTAVQVVDALGRGDLSAAQLR